MILSVSAAAAQSSNARNFPSSLSTPLLDHDAVAQPYLAPNHSAAKPVDPTKFQRSDLPQRSLDTIDLDGKSALKFDVKETAPRAVANVPDFSNVIVPLAPGKKRETPRYFGLTLSAPTH